MWFGLYKCDRFSPGGWWWHFEHRAATYHLICAMYAWGNYYTRVYSRIVRLLVFHIFYTVQCNITTLYTCKLYQIYGRLNLYFFINSSSQIYIQENTFICSRFIYTNSCYSTVVLFLSKKKDISLGFTIKYMDTSYICKKYLNMFTWITQTDKLCFL